MRSWYVKREYPEKLIDSEIWKAKFNTRETNRKNKSKNGVPVMESAFCKTIFLFTVALGKISIFFISLYIYIYIYIYIIDYLHLFLTRFNK